MSIFKQFTTDQEWPAAIAHLKGKTLCRKRDGNRYRIERTRGEWMAGEECAYLVPTGGSDGRSHWKTHSKILKELEVQS